MQLDLGNQPVERLADMLREAQNARAIYEQRTNREPTDWPTWYARHIIDRLTEDESSRSE
jgi:hypothetical protein